MTETESWFVFILGLDRISKWHISLLKLLLLFSLLIDLEIAIKVWVVEHLILLSSVSTSLTSDTPLSQHYFLWSRVIIWSQLYWLPLWTLVDTWLLVGVKIPEIVIIARFHYGVLECWIVEISIIHQKELSFVDRKIGRDIFVLECTRYFVKHSEVVLSDPFVTLFADLFTTETHLRLVLGYLELFDARHS